MAPPMPPELLDKVLLLIVNVVGQLLKIAPPSKEELVDRVLLFRA
jgi:hypothetical protein